MQTLSSLSPKAIATYRRTFQQRAQARFQAREKRRQQAKRAVCDAIRMVMPHYPSVQQVYLFGSVIKPGAFRRDSDVDIGVVGANMALCLDIWRDLEQAAPEWMLDVRSLDAQNRLTKRIRQKGELIYERSIPASQVGYSGRDGGD